MGEFFTVDQVAKILDMHPRTVRRYVREGQLRATKVGGEWRIRREDADMTKALVTADFSIGVPPEVFDGSPKTPIH